MKTKYYVVCDDEGYFLMSADNRTILGEHVISEHETERDAERALSKEIQKEG